MVGKSVPSDQGAPPIKRGAKKAQSSDPTVVESYSDLDEAGKVKFWASQIDSAEKSDEKWRKESQRTIETYNRGSSDDSTDSIAKFNILNSNVNVLLPAIYSATPKPDVRRRFPTADPTARFTAEVLERALEYTNDQFDVDSEAEAACLDMLLPGRGVCRIMYEAETKQVSPGRKFVRGEQPGTLQDESGALASKGESGWMLGAGEPPEALSGEPEAVGGGDFEQDDDIKEWYFGGTPYPKVEYECCWFQHVNWSDFRMGAGRSWNEVEWIAFKQPLTRDQLRALPIKRELADKVELDYDIRTDKKYEVAKRDAQGGVDTNDDMPFRRGLVWEIWFKTEKKVIFYAPSVREQLLLEQEPEIKFAEFYPIPRPLYAQHNPNDTKPMIEYTIYKGLAEELNRAVRRMQKIVSALKVRGIYAGAVVDFERVFKGDDNELIPATDATAMLKGGGAATMDALIWMVPVDKLVQVLQQLYVYVQSVKQEIYEITGISDIARGATNANETLGAQQLKAQFASIRILPRQREMQRFMRDLIRLEAEVICKIFGADTLANMTSVKLPTAQEKQQAQAMLAQYQQAAAAAQAQGQQPPPPPQPPQSPDPDFPYEEYIQRPTWEDVLGVMRSNVERAYRIDIETDSTVASDIAAQQGAITELLNTIGAFFQQVAPVTQTPANPGGILPMKVAKSLLMAVVRRYRLGKEVEEELDMIGEDQQPAPQAPDPAMAKVEAESQFKQAELQAETQYKQADLQRQGQKDQTDAALKAHELDLKNRELDIRQQEVQGNLAINAFKVHLEGFEQRVTNAMDSVHKKIGGLSDQVGQMQADAQAPVEIVRGPDGSPVGVKKGAKVRLLKTDGGGKLGEVA